MYTFRVFLLCFSLCVCAFVSCNLSLSPSCTSNKTLNLSGWSMQEGTFSLKSHNNRRMKKGTHWKIKAMKLLIFLTLSMRCLLNFETVFVRQTTEMCAQACCGACRMDTQSIYFKLPTVFFFFLFFVCQSLCHSVALCCHHFGVDHKMHTHTHTFSSDVCTWGWVELDCNVPLHSDIFVFRYISTFLVALHPNVMVDTQMLESEWKRFIYILLA